VYDSSEDEDPDLSLEEWRAKFDDVAKWLDGPPGDADEDLLRFNPTRMAWAWSSLPSTYFDDRGYDGRGALDNLRMMRHLQEWMELWIPVAIDRAAGGHGLNGEQIAEASGMDLVELRAVWIRWAWRSELNAEGWRRDRLIREHQETAELLGCLPYWQMRQALPGADDVPATATIAGELRTG
jgi:hypothetical protein